MTRVRERCDADLDALLQIVDEVNRLDGYPPHVPADLRRFLASSRELRSWVVEDAGRGELLGHIALHRLTPSAMADVVHDSTGLDAERIGSVVRLFVARPARHRGIGRLLLDTAADHARRLGLFPALDVATHFAPAISLYESAGWVRAGEVNIAFRSPCSEQCGHPAEGLDEYVYVAPE